MTQQQEGDEEAAATSLVDCLHEFIETPALGADDNTASLCSKCRSQLQPDTTITRSFLSLPEILVIHLKRFVQVDSGSMTKLSTLVSFPVAETLDLSAYTDNNNNNNRTNHHPCCLTAKDSNRSAAAAAAVSSSYSNGSTQATDDCLTSGSDASYYLYAVCNHSGSSPQDGRYTAFCRNPLNSVWYSFDDRRVTVINSIDKLVTSDAYLLFYRRRSSDEGRRGRRDVDRLRAAIGNVQLTLGMTSRSPSVALPSNNSTAASTATGKAEITSNSFLEDKKTKTAEAAKSRSHNSSTATVHFRPPSLSTLPPRPRRHHSSDRIRSSSLSSASHQHSRHTMLQIQQRIIQTGRHPKLNRYRNLSFGSSGGDDSHDDNDHHHSGRQQSVVAESTRSSQNLSADRRQQPFSGRDSVAVLPDRCAEPLPHIQTAATVSSQSNKSRLWNRLFAKKSVTAASSETSSLSSLTFGPEDMSSSSLKVPVAGSERLPMRGVLRHTGGGSSSKLSRSFSAGRVSGASGRTERVKHTVTWDTSSISDKLDKSAVFPVWKPPPKMVLQESTV
jgi:hypothetical protein